MATKRLVPGSKTRDGLIHFKDGQRFVPEWQQPFLKSQNRIDMTYKEWVEKVVNPELVNAAARNAVSTSTIASRKLFSS